MAILFPANPYELVYLVLDGRYGDGWCRHAHDVRAAAIRCAAAQLAAAHQHRATLKRPGPALKASNWTIVRMYGGEAANNELRPWAIAMRFFSLEHGAAVRAAWKRLRIRTSGKLVPPSDVARLAALAAAVAQLDDGGYVDFEKMGIDVGAKQPPMP